MFRPLFAVGGQELGYLPGDRDEKMAPWAGAVFDALESIAGPEVVEEVLSRNLLEVLPLTHIRGRSLTDTFVIIDEAQNLERPVLLTALSRLGEGSRVVLTHDVAQRDNLRVGRHDGIASVIDSAPGPPALRPRHAHPQRAQPGRRPRDQPARRPARLTAAVPGRAVPRPGWRQRRAASSMAVRMMSTRPPSTLHACRRRNLMSKSDKRPIIKLKSTAGTGYTYVTRKNKTNTRERIELRKYDPKARQHVIFKEER